MTLRTPRRRISPRAKRRYRAIREFFRKALGSSQQDIKINSSIAVNVTDLKHKIVGIESQLHEVNRHCRDLVCLENNFRRDTQQLLTETKNQEDEELGEEEECSSCTTKSKSKTKLLYKNSSSAHKKSDESDYVYSPDNYQDQSLSQTHYNMTPGCSNQQLQKVRSKKSKVNERTSSNDCDSQLRKHKAKSTYENFQGKPEPECYKEILQPHIQPYHSPRNDSAGAHRHQKKSDRYQEYSEYEKYDRNIEKNYKEVKRNKSENTPKQKDKHLKSRKNKHSDPTLDDDFIADIIKRQYKPVKLFGHRNSVISQFSAPVCRDQEFSINEDIQEGTELCSCCYDGRQRSRYVRHHDLSDMRSICDTRLYSTQPKPRKHYHRRNKGNYNDSAYYDIIPVKEKSSPKSRRKFIEDNYIPYNDYNREVPPSPRTLRPRLNLKAQYYTEHDDHTAHGKVKRLVPVRSRRLNEYYENYETDVTSETIPKRSYRELPKRPKSTKLQTQPITPESGTLTSLQYSVYVNENNNNLLANDNNLNKTQDSDASADKTDKTLCEIKDILQNFLQEIKKDSPAQCEKPDSCNLKDKQTSGIEESSKLNTDIGAGTSSFNNFNGNPCANTPFMPRFTNPCCYPVMPICPLNCMQNPYVMPSPSYTCQNCSSQQKEAVCPECSKSKRDVTIGTCDGKNNETDELIKEIYKFVAQSPLMKRKPSEDKHGVRKQEAGQSEKVLTSRSVGSSSRTSRHDAKVGTPTMKCYSKSCEAIGSRMISDTNYYTTTTHSDTLLEKFSLEPITQSDSDISIASTTAHKVNRSKFHKVMQSLGFFKKKRKESTDDMETESSMEVNIKANKSPYRQNLTNYMMHEQSYFRPPPVPSYGPQAEGPYGYVPPYDRRNPCPCAMGPPITDLYLPHHVHQETIHEHTAAAHCRPPPPQPAPCSHMYSPHFEPPPPLQQHYNQPRTSASQPQPPICLQEVEVKSTGTQSERKMSFFRKFTKGPPRARVRSFTEPNRNDGTQTKSKEFCVQTKPPSKGFFAGFKELQEKIERDPVKFSFKTQNKLKDNDLNVRNVMLQKMFQRKNPFSPRNMMLKSFMGNNNGNQYSFGQQRPKLMYRPRFLF